MLVPDGDRHAMNRTPVEKLRDAMHIEAAIRYGYDVFVTPETRLLRKANPILQRWGIEVLRPSDTSEWLDIKSDWNGFAWNIADRTLGHAGCFVRHAPMPRD